jgi:hypothetical protein
MIQERMISLGREALLANDGAPESAVLSSQGGVPLGLPGETWPALNGEPLFPILTIATRELPVIPAFLSGNEYWSFFIQRDQYEQSVSRGSLVVRRYARLSELIPLPQPIEAPIERLGLSFSIVTDYPSRIALGRILGDDDDHEDLDEQYPCHAGIKLGGWPLLVQGIAFLATAEPDFQIQLDVTDLYMYADSGIGHVYGGLDAIIWESM